MNEKDEKAPVTENTSGQGKLAVVPQELMRWNWGAFILNWIWAISNNVWIGLLSLIPWVGVVMAIILGMKGNGWAWQNKRWDGIEQFRKTQRNWTKWGVILIITLFILGGIGGTIIVPTVVTGIDEAAKAKSELSEVQSAVVGCMQVHGLKTLPHPVTVATNDMGAFPDATSVAGSIDKQKTDFGGRYTSGDKKGYVLYQDDLQGDGDLTPILVPPAS